MDEKQKKKINRGIVIVTSILAAAVLGYIIYALVVTKKIGTGYYIVIISFLAAYWLLTNVVEVVLTKELEEKTPAQIKAYKIYAFLNLVGVGGLGYFAIAIGDNNGMMGALIYVATMMAKRRYWEEYMGIKKEEDDVSEADVIDEAEMIAGADVTDETKTIAEADATDEAETIAEKDVTDEAETVKSEDKA
ncbi:MAG: hypothetical protein PHE06_00895 [Lachnospiraceae bacterium]|nr:hypothetical protein [Lachnospiraceae bacterium]